ncbi:hypothetical protein AQUCO_03700127v1 [Aquilegia coerulea]|uniref:F-box domain-containing protein n=1 Tax=Aquilegia coerulea TaxID=218851 RepID=A0A2G5CTL3_AQUCA|nr:hypothetical protein AQUCO_03700127v1 [Aquilegia coerulea]
MMKRKEGLPMEMVMEILLRLPVKSLLRFRCVCKTWLEVLKNNLYFSNLHLHYQLMETKHNPNPNDDHGIVFELLERGNEFKYCYADNYNEIDKTTFLKFPFSMSCEIVGICNGLICLRYHISERNSNFYLWNPLIGDVFTVPYSIPIPSCFCNPGGIRQTVFGFGFHEDTNEFKVIRIFYVIPYKWKHLKSEILSHVSVYTLGTNSWRILPDISYKVTKGNESSVLVNGALHWFGAKTGTIVYDVIVSFDLKDEVFQHIPSPKGVRFKYPYSRQIGHMGGLLSFFSSLANEYLHIWVMKEYGLAESWTKQFIIGPSEILGFFPNRLSPLGSANNGDIIIQKDSSELLLYNNKTDSIKSLYKFEISLDAAYIYRGSLVSPTVRTRVCH